MRSWPRPSCIPPGRQTSMSTCRTTCRSPWPIPTCWNGSWPTCWPTRSPPAQPTRCAWKAGPGEGGCACRSLTTGRVCGTPTATGSSRRSSGWTTAAARARPGSGHRVWLHRGDVRHAHAVGHTGWGTHHDRRAYGGTVTAVLIVDDDPSLLRALRVNLTARGYQVHTAPDAATGLASASRHPPDLAIVDLGLPDMDGMRVIEGLR